MDEQWPGPQLTCKNLWNVPFVFCKTVFYKTVFCKTVSYKVAAPALLRQDGARKERKQQRNKAEAAEAHGRKPRTGSE
jgi:hypothetical protein